MSLARNSSADAPVYEVVIDEWSNTATYIHHHTGLRVECSQPVDLWHIKILPPVSMGDSELFHIGFAENQAEAEEKAKAWMADHPNGVVDTHWMQRRYDR